MKRFLSPIIVAMLVLFVTSAGYADEVSLRLVEATNNGKTVDAKLADVAPVLKGSLPFSNYRLLDEQAIRLPAATTTKLAEGFVVSSAGTRKQLKLTIAKGAKKLVNTTVQLKPKKPLVLGGFPRKTGKTILILKLK